MNFAKCLFRQTSVKYLGHTISSKGIEPLDDKVLAVAKMNPTTIAEMRSFIGLVQFYHKFLPDLASLSQPIRLALKSDDDSRIQSNRVISCVNQVKQALFCCDALAPL